jgi:hypothetical protein
MIEIPGIRRTTIFCKTECFIIKFSRRYYFCQIDKFSDLDGLDRAIGQPERYGVIPVVERDNRRRKYQRAHFSGGGQGTIRQANTQFGGVDPGAGRQTIFARNTASSSAKGTLTSSPDLTLSKPIALDGTLQATSRPSFHLSTTIRLWRLTETTVALVVIVSLKIFLSPSKSGGLRVAPIRRR